MRAIVDADAEPVDKLATEPARNAPQPEGDDFQKEQVRTRKRVSRVATHEPDDGEDHNNHDVRTTVQQSNSLCPRTVRNCKPVDQAEYGGEKTADDPGCDASATDNASLGSFAL